MERERDYSSDDVVNANGNSSALLASVREVHNARFSQLQQSGLVVELNVKGTSTVSETFFHAWWCSDEMSCDVMPLIQQIVTGSEVAMQGLIDTKFSSYCMLTTKDQYTIAGPLWAIALMHTVYGNKAAIIDRVLSGVNFDEKISIFCPLDVEDVMKSYIAQPLGEVMLISANPANLGMQVFNFLLEKIKPKTSITWDEFSVSLNSNARKSGLLETLLLEKMIVHGKTEFAVALIKRNPALLKDQSTQGNLSLLELIIKKDQFQILDSLTTDSKPLIEVIDEIIPKLLAPEAPNNLSEEQKSRLASWHDASKKTTETTPLGRIFAMGVYVVSTPLAFLAAIAFSGIGDSYLKEVLAEASMPTGVVPASIVVLVISGISAVLTEWGYGLIDKKTAGSFIISAILPLFPGVPPGGPKIPDSLGTLDSRAKAIAEAATALLMLATVGIGLMFISKLPEWSAACAALPPYHLMVYVTVATAVINAVLVPPVCKAFYDEFTSGGKNVARE